MRRISGRPKGKLETCYERVSSMLRAEGVIQEGFTILPPLDRCLNVLPRQHAQAIAEGPSVASLGFNNAQRLRALQPTKPHGDLLTLLGRFVLRHHSLHHQLLPLDARPGA